MFARIVMLSENCQVLLRLDNDTGTVDEGDGFALHIHFLGPDGEFCDVTYGFGSSDAEYEKAYAALNNFRVEDLQTLVRSFKVEISHDSELSRNQAVTMPLRNVSDQDEEDLKLGRNIREAAVGFAATEPNDVALVGVCAKILLGQCAKVNATFSVFSFKGMTNGAERIGNWDVTVQRTDV